MAIHTAIVNADKKEDAMKNKTGQSAESHADIDWD